MYRTSWVSVFICMNDPGDGQFFWRLSLLQHASIGVNPCSPNNYVQFSNSKGALLSSSADMRRVPGDYSQHHSHILCSVYCRSWTLCSSFSWKCRTCVACIATRDASNHRYRCWLKKKWRSNWTRLATKRYSSEWFFFAAFILCLKESLWIKHASPISHVWQFFAPRRCQSLHWHVTTEFPQKLQKSSQSGNALWIQACSFVSLWFAKSNGARLLLY